MFSFKKGINSHLQQPIDRTALSLILVLSVLIVILLWSGDHSSVYVRDFSWKNKQIGAEDNAFIFTFSRPRNHASVEANLHISPPLPGKFSWAGRRMSYTLNSPAHSNQIDTQISLSPDGVALLIDQVVSLIPAKRVP